MQMLVSNFWGVNTFWEGGFNNLGFYKLRKAQLTKFLGDNLWWDQSIFGSNFVWAQNICGSYFSTVNVFFKQC